MKGSLSAAGRSSWVRLLAMGSAKQVLKVVLDSKLSFYSSREGFA